MLTAKQARVRDLFKAQRAHTHIVRLCEFGDRFVGTAGDRGAIGYVEGEFAKLGLDISRTPIKVPGFVDVETRLVVGGKAFEAVAAYYTPSTRAAGVTAEVVYAGTGEAQEYDGLDVRGKIVLIQERGLGYARFWLGTFAAEAARRGAVGMIVVHPMPWPYRMSIEAGNSKIENRFLAEQVPAVCVSAVAGQDIMWGLGRGGDAARATLTVRTEIPEVESLFLVGRSPGADPGLPAVLLEAHRDNGIAPGANDNASGSGVLLELARVLSGIEHQRDLYFVSSTAEEGVTQGAWSFVGQRKDDLIPNLKAMLNLDMIGVGGRLNLVEVGLWPDCDPIQHPEWLNVLLEEIAADMGYHLGRMTAEWGVAEEARYIAAGVPSAWFWKPDDPYYHSVYDTPDKIDGNSLKAVGDIAGAAAIFLADE
ncbi:MAG: M28 family metallopeptidase [Thermoleophilia bacterium]|nr:M28 family metallopeptidase [Thermoleophilia bacterium]